MKGLGLLFLILCILTSGIAANSDDQEQNVETRPGQWVILPVVSYAPETKLGVGALGMHLFKFNRQDTLSRTSNVQAYFIYTTENQVLTSPSWVLFSNREKYMMIGNFKFFKFPQFYYGIGDDLPEENEEEVDYDLVSFENKFLRKVQSNLFAGMQLRYFYRYNVEREEGGLLEATEVAGFNGSTVIGFGPSFLFDSRDNVVNASKGSYVDVSATFHGNYLGSEFDFGLYRIDVRKYFLVNKDKRHILAFQGLGNFISGTAPFKQLSELGSDQIMRGYYPGRYRDNHLLAFQAEYRMPVWRWFGLVGFLGAGDVAHEIGDFDFENIKPTYGLGFRVKINKKENVNIRADFGLGKDTNAFYLNITESF